MKIKDINLTEYNYKRICIRTEHGTVFMPEGMEEKLFELYGEEDIDAAGIEAAESGWLKLCPTKYAK